MNPSDSLHRFYSGFVDKYDLFASWEERKRREGRFFRQILQSNGVESVIDCFCGTGFHVAMLSEMGYHVDGIDISPHMIRKAKENLKDMGLDDRVRVGDVKELVAGEKYDCALSMGNSLPHEFGDENVLKALEGMYGALKYGGIVIIHMENFDRLYEDKERFIPSVYRRTGDGTEAFIFAIDYYEDRVVFNILSLIERGGKPGFEVDVVEYNPINVESLKRLLKEAGFSGLALYEDFMMRPLGRDGTYDLIVVARKRQVSDKRKQLYFLEDAKG
ncbi:Methylase involved in ubiquinone/menaquinone biosynthesis [Methanocella conradii HZ254]|uniref:Methylase involved in ubiquinone/menaquinone biosynthesis n=1 Tax=Methanocella conradii (strain DSM 24694 / JCM 17849 / CGMCC 1.5162 / HZ254) TaxID=1041930 RepID=H8I9X8_METCZ|nr:class I SAM-dependent methyltransferase [Methanocella conradii]AFD00938.1 Methylase involved in ubiquinone/menaquinone biosynthesis [Methanocella conradii HZ254]